MRIFLVICAVILLPLVTSPQQIPAWKTKGHYVLEDGNQLYSDCQSWHRNTVTSGDRIFPSGRNLSEIYTAGACWGYILGVVDSIPASEGFDPAPSVRVTQYIDAVTDYLKSHPQLRDRPAYGLARDALTEAFPPR